MLLKLRRFFKKHPLMKDMISFGGMYVGAEWTQQTMLKRMSNVDQDPKYDKQAFAHYSFYGFLWYPVVYHYWYRWLDARFVGTSAAVIGKKLLLDQFVMEPPLLASFYVGMSVMEGQEDIFKECKQKYITTFLSGCVFWLPAMSINFWLLPNSMRVIFLGVCSFVWCNFICWYKKQ
ncbi:mpv17-like protein isoform X1 [Portunus trituberculatus]|uniref:mpv17-like protein isoform X1 n=2 Tax=Portunus trituberculatus TaxID=210409 RepID=UPI001E1CE8F5|nr:mpv17-like protein isoform X1 [Portunus trituberculatus]XP_045129868.1 mpv17-like protein isoform X1 [Portunus trituberculatus]XP_045129869.1 mpv17-like protein isoform X1 [Portunus trituberculatus]XP_045129870.1 mpv17-like protein isoform X1 [Portunus trituberculatus]